MDRETYEAQKRFAGEKKALMQRRCVGHDYQDRQMYMITMVTEGRRPRTSIAVDHPRFRATASAACCARRWIS